MCLTYNPSSRRNMVAPADVLTLYKVVKRGSFGFGVDTYRTYYRGTVWHRDRVNVARGALRRVRYSDNRGEVKGGALHFFDTRNGAEGFTRTRFDYPTILTCYVLGADVVARGRFKRWNSTAAKRCYPTKEAALRAARRRGLV